MNGRLQILLSDPVVQEIFNFRVKADKRTGHKSFEAWRENEHDDLVFATVLAAWCATSKEYKTRVYRDYYKIHDTYGDYNSKTVDMR